MSHEGEILADSSTSEKECPAVEVRAFKMVCSICGSTQFSISEPGVGRPKEWPIEVLGVADCRGCQRPFLVKLPQELAWIIYRHISMSWLKTKSINAIARVREALGLR